MKKFKIGIIGCGNISGIYAKNLTQVFRQTELAACADLFYEKAEALAKEFDIPAVLTVQELLDTPEIDIVLNLTIPSTHAAISMQALEAGKHVYSEKPLATNTEDAKRLLDKAQEKGLRIGCAPDTFLGASLQTCRKLIDDGWIGTPVGATAFMMGVGPETWHGNPDFFYKMGGGPLFDMGPYYLNALIHLLGDIKRVSGTANRSFPTRTITTKHRFGEEIPCEVPTHIASVLDFSCGAVANMIMTFDTWGSKLPFIEIYGNEGTINIPDPNFFGGPVYYKKKGASQWSEIPLLYGFDENSRGIGIADMAYSIEHGISNRAGSEMAFHVLEVMQGIYEASQSGTYYIPQSSCKRPEPLPMGFPEFILG